MATPVRTGLVWEDLLAYGEDGVRRELIRGELYVTPAARTRHQHVVVRFGAVVLAHTEQVGGWCGTGPNLYLARDEVCEPDLVALGPGDLHRLQGLMVVGPPTLVVEVSSPGNRRYDLRTKRALYERHGVPEYWFADLDADQLRAFRLDGGNVRYGEPEIVGRGGLLAAVSLPGLVVDVDWVLGRPGD